jgi:hypothetical protein
MTSRKDHKDVPKTILLTEELARWSENHAEELDVSYGSYIRKLITEDRERVERKLSQAESENNTPEPHEVLASMIRLLTEHPELTRLLWSLFSQR